MAASATCMANRVGLHPVDAGHRLGRRHRLGHREPGLRGDQRLHLGDGRGEHRFGRPAARRPSPPTASPARRTPIPVHARLARPRADTESRPRRPRASRSASCLEAVGEDRRTHRPVVRAAGPACTRHPSRESGARALDPVGQPAGGLAQPVGRGGRQREQQRPVDRGIDCRVVGAVVSGACSRIACTLVPDNPYDDTAARRGAGDRCWATA